MIEHNAMKIMMSYNPTTNAYFGAASFSVY